MELTMLNNALCRGARLSYGNRWICVTTGFADGLEYTVYEHKPYQKGTTVLRAYYDLNEALEKLMEED